jgi:hypothetical protein
VEAYEVVRCLENWLIDGGQVVSLTSPVALYPKKYLLVLISVKRCGQRD